MTQRFMSGGDDVQGDIEAREEFEMLLEQVLGTLANPEPLTGLREKVMMRLRMAELEAPGANPHRRIELAGTPIFGEVRERRSGASTWFAMGLHAAAVLLVGFLVARNVRFAAPVKETTIVALEAPPVPAPLRTKIMGGGGGQKGPTPVTKGTPPKFSPRQLVPPKALVQAPKLAVLPTVDVDPTLKMASNMPDVGVVMANASKVGVSMGNGNGSGLGSGVGNGVGPGAGGNMGGGIRQIGGGVSAPKLIFQPEAEFSEEARKAKLTGNVLVSLVVDENGSVMRARVLKGVGMGLDEKALEAVRQYRFKPALENGKPVKVEVNVEVNFHIF